MYGLIRSSCLSHNTVASISYMISELLLQLMVCWCLKVTRLSLRDEGYENLLIQQETTSTSIICFLQMCWVEESGCRWDILNDGSFGLLITAENNKLTIKKGAQRRPVFVEKNRSETQWVGTPFDEVIKLSWPSKPFSWLSQEMISSDELKISLVRELPKSTYLERRRIYRSGVGCWHFL